VKLHIFEIRNKILPLEHVNSQIDDSSVDKQGSFIRFVTLESGCAPMNGKCRLLR